MAGDCASTVRGRQSRRGISLWRVVVPVVLLALMLASPAQAADLDNDGIPDEFEDQLLQRFAPVIKLDQLNTTPSEFRAIPVSASWFAREIRLRYERTFGPLTVFSWELNQPTAEQMLIYFYAKTNRADASYLYLSFEGNQAAKWGDSATEPTSWPDAIARQRGVYGRVWQPWRSRYPNLYSVQYFMLLTWNETGDCDVFNSYRHDGDVLCFDYCVDASTWGGPTIIHAVYHNHGRQILVTRDALQFENGHPIAFLERGANEPWPNPGTDGSAGYPQMDGAALTEEICEILDESCCVRQHQGEGNVYRTANIPNIGECPWPDRDMPVEDRPFYPMGSLDSQLFLVYPGAWGYRGGPPKGPAYQHKIWRREIPAPWAAAGASATNDVLRPNLDAFSLRTAFRTVGTNWVPYDFLPICDVRAGNTNEQRGLPSKPYGSVTQGAQKVATYGVLRVAGGTYSESLEISKPMLIESAGGMVTIGR